MLILLIVIVLSIVIAIVTFFTVEQQTTAIIERFGKFVRVSSAGLCTKIPFIENVAARISMRVKQLDVQVETKTKDNVFAKIIVSVQYRVLEHKIYEAYYKLDNPEQQITAFIFDVVRARVPQMVLDDVFEKKDDIADAVKHELSEVMADFGYEIVKALVTDIDPDAKVKAAMNEINEAQRLRVAANERGEAEKILKVKQAEGEAESKALQGRGIADQRRAIVEGLKESVDAFQKTVSEVSAGEVFNLVLMTQYFDTLKEIGGLAKTNTILIPHSPGHISDLAEQIRTSIITANQVASDNQVIKHQ